MRLTCESAGVGAPADNLVVRAAQAILKYDHLGRGLDIELTKRIPVAAGLGGGSSDAATTLMAVNCLLDLNLNCATLHREALALGADVPFFLYSPVAWASGIGDQLRSITICPKFWLVLVNPGVSVSTAQVYGGLEASSYTTCQVVDTLATPEELVAVLHNDLEPVTMNLCSQVAQIKTILIDFGAAGALMSGSGSTVFGIYFDEAKAKKVSSLIQQQRGWWTVVASDWSE